MSKFQYTDLEFSCRVSFDGKNVYVDCRSHFGLSRKYVVSHDVSETLPCHPGTCTHRVFSPSDDVQPGDFGQLVVFET